MTMLSAIFPQTMVEQVRMAEEATLGSVLINPDIFPLVRGIVVPDDFSIHRHRWIFEAMGRLHDRHEAIDLTTVGLEIGQKVYEIGGPAFLTSLMNHVGSSFNAETYARQVRDFAIFGRLASSADEIATLARAGGDVHDVVARSLRSVQNATLRVSTGRSKTAATLATENFEYVAKMADSPEMPGIKTPFVALNNMLGGGMYGGQSLLVAGFPGGGKTSFLDQVAAFVAKSVWVDLFTMEMTSEEQTTRILSQLSGVSSQTLRSGKLNDDQWARYTEAMGQLAGLKLRIEDGPQTIETIRATAMRHKAAGELGLVVIDYAGLIKAPGASMLERYNYISTEIKNMAVELSTVPVLSAHQLNREAAQQDKPTMFNLLGSGQWERDADVVGLIYEAKGVAATPGYLPRVLELGKQRSGPVGPISLEFHPSTTTFRDTQTKKVTFNG